MVIKHALGTLGLEAETSNGKYIPAKGKPLVNHLHGDTASVDCNYSSVVVGTCWSQSL